ncbi:carboxymuconolactone decarboxylase family protein [Paraburkholderia phymatum]|uniref:Carboxymuconolactone decarboxylase family protein n=1 Tax=Paraburkholderia phymatum TaxID=148447 RepID=A0ACC6UEF3_9BURK
MMHDWNDYRASLLARVADYADLSPEVMKGLHMIESSPEKNGTLGPKIHELISLAVAVTTRCDGCISVHTKKAVEQGATREEIAEALSVAIAMNAGPALVYTARVLEAHAQLPNTNT